ncbi:hypothetical protein BCR43DRAFT_559697 [Syncephalastrum racemosum]|uniref:AMP-dependent synthetase/ligase domain-containing protein n=1 Tax=Syncephalastrum racemosum TaxID=13706 RepID=A0A1X2HTL0_SYNRA|nr:hypothetical protein BCR43DRAFT_559697 [Syncephalastrum racemosum]
MVFIGNKVNEPLPDVSIYEALFENKKYSDDTIAYVDAGNPSRFLTLGTLRDRVLKMGGALQQNYRWQKQDVLVMCAENDIDYIVGMHASVTIGGISAGMDHRISVGEMQAILNQVDAKLVLTDEKTYAKVSEAAIAAEVPNKILTFKALSKLLDTATPAEPIRYTPQQLDTTPAYFCFTSGTTGKSKATMLSQRNIMGLIYEKLSPAPGSKSLTHLELHHISQLRFSVHMVILNGSTCYVMKSCSRQASNMRRVLENVQKYSIDGMQIYPRLLRALVDDPQAANYDMSSIKFLLCSGAPMPRELLEAAHGRFNMKLINEYGLTEVGGALAGSFQATMRGSPGKVGPRSVLKLVDPDGNEVGPNEPGELCVKSPMVTLGYYKDPEATRALIDDDGFLHTGDIFSVSQPEEEFRYVCRFKDQIFFFPHLLVPQEIENVVLQHPKVASCCVMGAGHKKLMKELVTAFVTLTKECAESGDDTDIVKREIDAFVEAHAPDSYRLRGGIYILDKLPLTSMGKVKKLELWKNYIKPSQDAQVQ